jgi:hypothetical protein
VDSCFVVGAAAKAPHSMTEKPKNTPAASTASPYISPALTINREAAELPELDPEPLSPDAVVVAAAPPKPVYTTLPSAPVEAAAPGLVEVAGMVVIVLVFTLVGFKAPQG